MPLLPVDEALARVLERCVPLGRERVRIDDAVGRVTAEDVLAVRTLPPWNNSAMDGYAVRSADLGAVPRAAGGGGDHLRGPDAEAAARRRPGGAHHDGRAAARGRGHGGDAGEGDAPVRRARGDRRGGGGRARTCAARGEDVRAGALLLAVRDGPRAPGGGGAVGAGARAGGGAPAADGGHRLERRRAVPGGRGPGRPHRRHQLAGHRAGRAARRRRADPARRGEGSPRRRDRAVSARALRTTC